MLTTSSSTSSSTGTPQFRTLDSPPVGAELQHSIEQFFYAEAELLDDWQWRRWFDLFTDDAHYRMPIRRNQLRRQRKDDEAADTGFEVAHFDDNKASMDMRIQQLETGLHWAEDPPSRSRHLVTNVRIRSADTVGEYYVRSNFLVYRNRLEAEVDLWAGERRDVLRESASGFAIADRVVLLDQNLVLSKNLSVFF